MVKIVLFALVTLFAVVAMSAPADQAHEMKPEAIQNSSSSKHVPKLTIPKLDEVIKEDRLAKDRLLKKQLNEEEHKIRLPRATCDLLSGFGVNDSACAVHCLARGKRGGWCDKGVCHCR